VRVRLGISRAVVMPVVAAPPQRSLLQAGGAQPSKRELA